MMARAEQSRAEQSRAEQSRAEQSRAEQSRAEQSRAEQSSHHRYHINAVTIGIIIHSLTANAMSSTSSAKHISGSIIQNSARCLAV